jgi:O-antigen/teichoic acid export membrane protein
MIDFLKKSTWSFSSIVIKSICALAVNKMIAVYFGTVGITIFAHFQNLISLITQVPNDGVNRGIIKYWSGNELNQNEKYKLFKAGFILNIIILVITLILIYVFRGYVLRDFDFNFNVLTLILFLTGILLYIIHLFLLSVILSYQKIKIYALINAIASIVVVLAILVISGTKNLYYTLITFILAQAAASVLSFIYCLNKMYIKPVKERMAAQDFRKLGEFVLMALSVLLFGKITDFIIRDYAIQHFGLHQTGLWQSIVKISDGYMMLFINTVGIVYYPQISALILNTDRLRQYLRDVLKIVIIVSVTGLILIYVGRIPVLTLLYNKEFIPAGDLMPMQFIGDFFCIISYLLTYIISAQARTRTFIILQAVSTVFYIFLVYIFSTYSGIEGIPIAHAIRYLILAIILIILNKRIIF